jgi:hemolysin-activating ACP:hemolysin acyltransferase
MPITVRKMSNPWLALGLAAHFVARQGTFGRFPAADLIRTLDSQISRGHYLFALDVSTKPARVLGYFGWALYNDAEAERFAASGVPPREERADGGSVIWILTAAAASRTAFFALVTG